MVPVKWTAPEVWRNNSVVSVSLRVVGAVMCRVRMSTMARVLTRNELFLCMCVGGGEMVRGSVS